MLGWFPTPHHDELFYSLCARYAEAVRYPNNDSILRDIFGNRHPHSILLPTCFENVINNLPENYCLNLEKVIFNHTLFPYYTSFLSIERTQKVYLQMVANEKTNPYGMAGGHSHYVKPKKFLMFCPCCATDEIESGNSPYWHRLHQLPGVYVCPTHHVFLRSSEVSLLLIKNKRLFFTAAEEFEKVVVSVEKIDAGNSEHQILLYLAVCSQELISNYKLRYTSDILREVYLELMIEKGCARKGGNVRYEEFTNLMRNNFSAQLLESLGCGFDTRGKNKWHLKILISLKSGYMYPPLRYLLVNYALGLDLIMFLDLCEELKIKPLRALSSPFSSENFPCLNPVCEFYEKLTIDRFETKLTKSRISPLKANFVCRYCGCAYSRSVDEEGKVFGDSYFIYQRGAIWEEELKRLWNNSDFSNRDMKVRLGCEIDTIKKNAIKQNLTFPRIGPSGKYSRLGKNLSRQNLINEKRANEFLRKKRIQWVSILNRHPEATRTFLRRKYTSQYKWSLKNDTEWFSPKLPPTSRKFKGGLWLDWNKRDCEFAKKIQTAAKTLTEDPQSPQIRKLMLLRQAGISHHLVPHCDKNKLPKTFKQIEKNIETYAQYVYRKANPASNHKRLKLTSP